MLGAGADAWGGAGGLGRVFHLSCSGAGAPWYMLGNARSAGLLHGLGFSPFGAVVQRKNTARDALVDIRQIILTPEQWHCLNPMEITTPRVTSIGR